MKRGWKIVLQSAVVLAGMLAYVLTMRPSVESYHRLELPAAEDLSGLRVTFLGVSTLLVRDGTAAILIDGFFSRPGLIAMVTGDIAPDLDRISKGLRLGDIEQLDAVLTAHSHYDHAMDSPEVAARTGAVLIGSESTANIGRGWKLADERIRVIRDGEPMHFGDLTVTFVPSQHFPHKMAMGDITEPLVPPAPATAWKEGGAYSIFIERRGRTILVQASAGYIVGALAGRKADVVYLGIGLLTGRDDGYRDAYWRQTVGAVGAKRVIPIHWDDFTRGLDEPLVPFLSIIDNLDTTMRFVETRARQENVELRWPTLGVATDPFAGL